MKQALLLTLAVIVLAPSPGLGDPDLRTAVPAFKKNFAPGMSLYTRRKALEEISRIGDPAVLKSFDWALATTRNEVRRLVLEKDDATKEVKRLEKQLDDLLLRESQRARERGREPGPVSVQATLLQNIARGRRKVDGLQQSIDEEYEARDDASVALGEWITGLDADDRSRVFRELTRGRVSDRDWTTRSFFAKGLGVAEVPEAARLLLERLAEEQDRRVLPLVIDACAARAGEMAVPDLLMHLSDERWQIRAAVIAALGRIGSPKAISRLIERLKTEDGRLRGDIADVLKKLTGEDLGISAERWEKWWEKNESRFTGPKPKEEGGDADPDGLPAPGGGDKASFYGIEVVSKHVLFVIDISNSMNEVASTKNQERSKVDVAKYELKNALLSLPEDATFNIVFYHHEVSQWRKGMVTAKGKEKRGAVKFVEEMVADGNTNIYDALKLAFHIVGMGAHDKNYDIGADTIFFLSDGKPNRGDITDPGQILSEVKRWNELRRVKIHAVGVGSNHDSQFMRSIAEMSGGKYVKR